MYLKSYVTQPGHGNDVTSKYIEFVTLTFQTGQTAHVLAVVALVHHFLIGIKCNVTIMLTWTLVPTIDIIFPLRLLFDASNKMQEQ